jgi:hypothetical protein
MTTERAQAYSRVLNLLDDAYELDAVDCELLRGAADVLLFAREVDSETFEAVSEARALAHSLVDSGRCRMELAAGLLVALRGCGPPELPPSMTSLRDQRFSKNPFWSRVGR